MPQSLSKTAKIEFNPLSQSTFIESREEFGGQIREHVWGTKPGTPPRTWVGGNDVVGY